MEEKYDLFISYNRADTKWAEWIAWQLEEAKYSTILQAWDFRPGSNFVLDMQKAAENAHRTVMVLSPSYLKSLYTQPEWAAAFARDSTGEKGLLVPVRVKECALKGILAQIVYIDIVDFAEAEAKEALIQGIKKGRIKPVSAPAFPSTIRQFSDKRPRYPGALSPVLRVPVNRNTNFTGRESELNILLEQLNSDDPPKSTIVDGYTDNYKMSIIMPSDYYYGKNREIKNIKEPYEVGIYLVTNNQYRKFIDDHGYINEDLWSESGLVWKKDKMITHPNYWNNIKWNSPDLPVIGISLHEAKAYAKWCGMRIPTQEEWERAARGLDGRIFPWGDAFKKDMCNTAESGLNSTSVVYSYPSGVSPEGCYDMSGNVWEWTTSRFDDDHYILRGGSWELGKYYAISLNFIRLEPSARNKTIGFRCVKTIENHDI